MTLRYQLLMIEQHAARQLELMESDARAAKLAAAVSRQRVRRAQASVDKANRKAQEALQRIMDSHMPQASPQTKNITMQILVQSRLLSWSISLLPWYSLFVSAI